jgi:hypothetical protein
LVVESQLGIGSAVSRRRFVQTAAVAAAGFSGSLTWPASGAAAGGAGGVETAVPPEPIPGGITFPSGQQIHVWAPGDPSVTLPFSGTKLMGFDVDPTSIDDFDGFSAVAFHAGTATGSDGRTYNLETDLRTFRGTYVARDGTLQSETFAFI